MPEKLSIGSVARMTGLTAKTNRFYEEGGYIPVAMRAESGYRRYSDVDVRRLRLIRRMRLLGLPLSQVKPMVSRAFEGDCSEFAQELTQTLAEQKQQIVQRIAELEALMTELDELSAHVEHCQCAPGQTLADCGYCSILDEEGGDSDGCECG